MQVIMFYCLALTFGCKSFYTSLTVHSYSFTPALTAGALEKRQNVTSAFTVLMIIVQNLTQTQTQRQPAVIILFIYFPIKRILLFLFCFFFLYSMCTQRFINVVTCHDICVATGLSLHEAWRKKGQRYRRPPRYIWSTQQRRSFHSRLEPINVTDKVCNSLA